MGQAMNRVSQQRSKDNTGRSLCRRKSRRILHARRTEELTFSQGNSEGRTEMVEARLCCLSRTLDRRAIAEAGTSLLDENFFQSDTLASG